MEKCCWEASWHCLTPMQDCSRHADCLPCTIWATHGPHWASNHAVQKLPPKAQNLRTRTNFNIHLIECWPGNLLGTCSSKVGKTVCFILLLCRLCPHLLTCLLPWPACRWQVDSAMAWLRSFTRNVRHLADAEHGKAALVVVHEDSSVGENRKGVRV